MGLCLSIHLFLPSALMMTIVVILLKVDILKKQESFTLNIGGLDHCYTTAAPSTD